MPPDKKASELYRRIWETVARIPRGKVASYGQVARIAGFPRHARHVSYALNAMPRGSKLPWHRVINSQGKLSFPPRSAPWKRQRKLLEAEGLVFIRGRVNLDRHGWQPADPSPLLD